MLIEVKVPPLPESVADATIAAWHKNPGDRIHRDENIVDLETDKVVLEVPSPSEGILKEILFKVGDVVKAGILLARIEPVTASDHEKKTDEKTEPFHQDLEASDLSLTSPTVRRMLAEHALEPSHIKGTGKDGRLTKEDVIGFIQSNRTSEHIEAKRPMHPSMSPSSHEHGREERRVPMSRLRAKVAERLLQAQHSAAMLTTFNEVNLKAVMDIRAQYKDVFEKKHGVKLGFMSFFSKAVVEALKRFPEVNASIDNQDIVYHGYYDLGIAISTERGLVVPVLRSADQLSMAEIEQKINEYAERARSGKLSIEEMQGGTFTITNGGVFGSLLSTPIINPPQTAILGMHKIEERPIVESGQIVIRPMMYLALSYDHRLVDGKDSVQFLVAIKSLLEDPARLILNV